MLNATFGNAAELIITIFAIRAGQLEVATASITGSILGNTLLVLGASFFVGGLRNGLQSFNQRVAGMNASMLALAVIGLGIPTLFGHVADHPDVQAVSDVTAGILLTLYVLMLVFYFRTPEVAHSSSHEPIGPHWPGRLAMLLLLLSTGTVAVMSDVFVGTLDAVISDVGISAVFLGLIIVPLVGNVAEHMAAVKIAAGGRLDFAMGIAFNSALQVALGVTAVAIAAGYIFDNELVLDFKPLELAFLIAATILAGIVASNGAATWIEGVQLLAIYLMACIVFWYL